jgi:hypothetical protein
MDGVRYNANECKMRIVLATFLIVITDELALLFYARSSRPYGMRDESPSLAYALNQSPCLLQSLLQISRN